MGQGTEAAQCETSMAVSLEEAVPARTSGTAASSNGDFGVV